VPSRHLFTLYSKLILSSETAHSCIIPKAAPAQCGWPLCRCRLISFCKIGDVSTDPFSVRALAAASPRHILTLIFAMTQHGNAARRQRWVSSSRAKAVMPPAGHICAQSTRHGQGSILFVHSQCIRSLRTAAAKSPENVFNGFAASLDSRDCGMVDEAIPPLAHTARATSRPDASRRILSEVESMFLRRQPEVSTSAPPVPGICHLGSVRGPRRRAIPVVPGSSRLMPCTRV